MKTLNTVSRIGWDFMKHALQLDGRQIDAKETGLGWLVDMPAGGGGGGCSQISQNALICFRTSALVMRTKYPVVGPESDPGE